MKSIPRKHTANPVVNCPAAPYHARHYVPEMGRFQSRDPMLYSGKDENLYRYVHNSPLGYVDPSGLIPPGWDSPGPGIALPGSGYPSPTPGGSSFGGSGVPQPPATPAPTLIPNRMVIVQTNMQLQPTGGTCGTHNLIFRIMLPDVAPCDGYLLQYVLRWEDVHGCTFLSASSKPIDTATQTPVDQYTERLAFIKKGFREGPLGNRSGHDYRLFRNPNPSDTCGRSLARGELKFFCAETTPEGHVGIGNEPDRWQSRVKAGGFAPTVPGRPVWWTKTPVFRDLLVSHVVWDCCTTPKDHGTFSWGTGFDWPPVPAGY